MADYPAAAGAAQKSFEGFGLSPAIQRVLDTYPETVRTPLIGMQPVPYATAIRTFMNKAYAPLSADGRHDRLTPVEGDEVDAFMKTVMSVPSITGLGESGLDADVISKWFGAYVDMMLLGDSRIREQRVTLLDTESNAWEQALSGEQPDFSNMAHICMIASESGRKGEPVRAAVIPTQRLVYSCRVGYNIARGNEVSPLLMIDELVNKILCQSTKIASRPAKRAIFGITIGVAGSTLLALVLVELNKTGFTVQQLQAAQTTIPIPAAASASSTNVSKLSNTRVLNFLHSTDGSPTDLFKENASTPKKAEAEKQPNEKEKSGLAQLQDEIDARGAAYRIKKLLPEEVNLTDNMVAMRRQVTAIKLAEEMFIALPIASVNLSHSNAEILVTQTQWNRIYAYWLSVGTIERGKAIALFGPRKVLPLGIIAEVVAYGKPRSLLNSLKKGFKRIAITPSPMTVPLGVPDIYSTTPVKHLPIIGGPSDLAAFDTASAPRRTAAPRAGVAPSFAPATYQAAPMPAFAQAAPILAPSQAPVVATGLGNNQASLLSKFAAQTNTRVPGGSGLGGANADLAAQLGNRFAPPQMQY